MDWGSSAAEIGARPQGRDGFAWLGRDRAHRAGPIESQCRRGRGRGRGRSAAIAAGLALALLAVPELAGAQQGEAPQDPAVRDALPPSVGLDRLLKLPDSYRSDSSRRGGATRAEWRQRFAEAQAGIETAQKDLEETQARLENAADEGGQWAATAPGISAPDATNSTVSYKLRQDLRRLREQLEDAEAQALDLQVRADLASVPADWRE